MESAETPRKRRANRAASSTTETSQAPSPAVPGDDAGPAAETPVAKISRRAPRTAPSTGLGDVAARRVAAAGAALGAQAAAGGNSINMPIAEPLSPAAALALGLDPKPQAVHSRLPETDDAIAAASAAAAAAVAAVSAAIAATAAAKASQGIAAAAIAAAPDVPVSAAVASAPAEAAATLAPPEAAPVPVSPTRSQVDPRDVPVSVLGYVRPPARDVPGLIRASRHPQATMAAAAEPETVTDGVTEPVLTAADAAATGITTTDTINATMEANSTQPAARKALALVAALVAMLAAAGIAFGHRIAPTASSLGAAIKSGAAKLHQRAPLTGLARVATAPIHPAIRWLSGVKAAPVYDEYGTERRRRPAPGWLLFIGFYLLIFGAIGANMFLGVTSADGAHPTPSALAVVDTATPTASDPAVSPTAAGTDAPSIDPNMGPAMVTSPPPLDTPTPVVTDAPTPTPPPTHAPTKKPAAKPTVRRTAAPTPVPPTPAPTPTPVLNFASFAGAGTQVSSGGSTYTATYTATSGTGGLTLILSGVGGASCDFSVSPGAWTKKALVIPGAAPSTNQIVIAPPLGKSWAVGTYGITATCTLSGYSTSTAHINVTITAPAPTPAPTPTPTPTPKPTPTPTRTP